MSCKVGIVDYGAGNIRSVYNAIRNIDKEPVLITLPENIKSCDKVILPGVGAFQNAMDVLKSNEMDKALNEYVKSGKLLLGICLGMQLMCLDSKEDGHHEGLGYIEGHVVPFQQKEGFKIPHMGWNAIYKAKDDPLLDDISDNSDVYFVHSFYVDCHDTSDRLLISKHSNEFVSGFSKDNLYGLQFHPEKSQSVGIKLLENFIAV